MITDSPLSDIELFRKISANDSRALETLYDRYSPLLFSLIKKIVSRDSIAEEILADVFSIIWKKVEYFNFSGGNVYSWLILLARNKAVDYIRRNRAANPLTEAYDDEYENNYIIPHISSSVAELDLKKAFESRSDIESSLGKLTDAQKYVIHLAFYEGYTQKEIAEKLNIPVQTIKSKLQIALNNLKDNLTHQAGI
ncbi:MAG: sigma-70 family RNA polymerase sigma factor [Bacteroidota bacterium]|nr:sigma-70 family RNA polymerase sigma factor [Bacteroidota bacterium]MDP4191292.1 sigma-70 family RNA polymerase sigma factor [Bacteroidota bacterium]MDP4195637.1 sigma-70 family RNA polymerase sigma factor [Bacteroidota bacterium]